MRYTALDELLSRPRVRALRALARRDWTDSADLYDACDISSDDLDRGSFAAALSALVRSADIDRRLAPTGRRKGNRASTIGQYRITDGGRASLRVLLASASPDPSEFLP